MAIIRAVSFDHSEITVIGRDDGNVALELRDGEEALDGIVLFDAHTAVQTGKLLVIKGQNALDLMRAEAMDSPAWRDRNANIWFGEHGADRMVPAHEGELSEHSWDEVSKHFGPLTAVTNERFGDE
jgi:hypothetical protein